MYWAGFMPLWVLQLQAMPDFLVRMEAAPASGVAVEPRESLRPSPCLVGCLDMLTWNGLVF